MAMNNGCLRGRVTQIHITGCKFSVAQILLASAQREGSSIRPEECTEKNAWDSEPACGTAMRVIAMFSGPCAATALTPCGSVLSHYFNGLEILPKLATS